VVKSSAEFELLQKVYYAQDPYAGPFLFVTLALEDRPPRAFQDPLRFSVAAYSFLLANGACKFP